jgi:hypothetical protein
MFAPLLLIAFGFLSLLGKLGYITFDWGLFWPVVIIILGASMLFRKSKGHCWCGICGGHHKHGEHSQG